MNNNATENMVFNFYFNMNTLLSSNAFDHKLAKEMVKLGADIVNESVHAPGLTRIFFENLKTGLTAEVLEEWHKYIVHPSRRGEDVGIELIESITEACFEDLALQMRNEPVRDLHKTLKTRAGIPDDLFIHARKITDLGDGVVAATLVIDDIQAYRKFLKDPEEYSAMHGNIHYSESKLAADPA